MKRFILFFAASLLSGKALSSEQSQEKTGATYFEVNARDGVAVEPAVKSVVSGFYMVEAGAGYSAPFGSAGQVGLGLYGGKGFLTYSKKDLSRRDYLIDIDLKTLATLKVQYVCNFSEKVAATAQAGIGTFKGEYRSGQILHNVTSAASGLTYVAELGSLINVHTNLDVIGGLSLSMVNMIYSDAGDKKLYLNIPALKLGLQYSL